MLKSMNSIGKEKTMSIDRIPEQFVPINKVKPNNWNPNHMNKEDMKKLQKSLDKYTFNIPIICDENWVIIDGEHRYQAAKNMGLKQVPVIVLSGLTEEEKIDLSLTANKLKGTLNPLELEKLIPILLANKEQFILPFTDEELILYESDMVEIPDEQNGDESLEIDDATNSDGVEEGRDNKLVKNNFSREPSWRLELMFYDLDKYQAVSEFFRQMTDKKDAQEFLYRAILEAPSKVP